MRSILIGLFLLGFFSCLDAQYPNSPIRGWKMQEDNGHVSFVPAMLLGAPDFHYDVYPLQPLGGEGISDWLSGPGRKDVEASGYTLMPGQQGKDVQSFRIFSVLAKDGAGKTWLINYMAYARPDHSVRYGRIVEEPNTAATKNNSDVAVQHFIRMSKQEMGGAGARAIRVETPTTAPGQGLKPAEIRGVVLHTEYGVGDARAVQSLPVALMTIPGRFGCLGPGRIRWITRRRRDISGNSEAAMENAANRIHKSNGKI